MQPNIHQEDTSEESFTEGNSDYSTQASKLLHQLGIENENGTSSYQEVFQDFSFSLVLFNELKQQYKMDNQKVEHAPIPNQPQFQLPMPADHFSVSSDNSHNNDQSKEIEQIPQQKMNDLKHLVPLPDFDSNSEQTKNENETYTVIDGISLERTYNSLIDFDSKDSDDKKTEELYQKLIKKLSESQNQCFQEGRGMNNFNPHSCVQLEILGRGSFGRVYRVFDKDSRNFYAMKEIKRESFPSMEFFQRTIANELYNLILLNSVPQDILLSTQYVELNEQEKEQNQNNQNENNTSEKPTNINNLSSVRIFMELGTGTLAEYAQYRQVNNIKWTQDELVVILQQLIYQIAYLRALGIYHRDIKPGNIICKPIKGIFKLTDYGCAIKLKSNYVREQKEIDVVGTPFYMAPEVLKAFRLKKRSTFYDPFLSDSYSIALTILKIIKNDLTQNTLLSYLQGEIRISYPILYSYLIKIIDEAPLTRLEGIQDILDSCKNIQQEKLNSEECKISDFQDDNQELAVKLSNYML